MALAFFASLVLVKLLFLQVVKQAEYSADAAEQYGRTDVLYARRGSIYDRNGNAIATTIDTTTIFVDPTLVTDPQTTAKELASVLGGKASDYLDKVTQEDTRYVFIDRHADNDKAKELEDKKLAGIGFTPSFKRVYPNGSVGAQVIGLVGDDDVGLSGLENGYNDLLAGTNGEQIREKGLHGVPIASTNTMTKPAQDGSDITTTLDIELQQQVEKVLQNGVYEYEATGGNAVVYDGATGEIYAAASCPLPDQKDVTKSESAGLTLKPITQAYEPGSTFKCITAAAGIDAGAITPQTKFTVPPALQIYDVTVTDAHDHGTEVMTLTDIIEQSSNIGIDLAEREIGDEKFYEYVLRFGMGARTGVDFPGESEGLVLDIDEWSGVTGQNMPFGQGIAASALQMVRAFGAFRNQGVMVTPHFALEISQADEQPQWQSTEVVSKRTAAEVSRMMETVVESGTGPEAQIDGYTVAGKTATAQYTKASGEYTQDTYNISFIGFLPKSTSSLVVSVTLENPKSTGTTAQLFAEIMRYIIAHYKIAPA